VPDLPELPAGLRERLRHQQPADASRDWYRIAAAKDKPKTAEIWIYERIGADWFDDGVDAKSFARKLQALDVDEIILHLNSPGGAAWDGIAIYNSLKDHKASVTVVVDGLAASAASFIAQSGDRIKMNRAAQMMIHDASGVAIGNAKDMAEFAEVLDKLSDSIAGIYAGRAGSTVAEWRTAMGRESWYTAAEAVEAGLADEMVEETPAEPKARARFDLAVFNFAGRSAAPPPPVLAHAPDPPPPAPTDPPADPPEPTPQEGAGMDPAKLREALGLAADASDPDVTAALTTAGITVAAPAAPPAGPNPGDPAPDPAPPPDTLPPRQPSLQAGVGSDAILLDPAQLRALQQQAVRGDEAYRRMKEAECETVLDAALKEGKFPPSRREHWKQLWAADPDGTKETVSRLAPNVIPVSLASGYPGVGDETEADMIYQAMYPVGGASRG
jgi:ATP-dependent Clp endopeptidase proteolytic subunit ClpP